LHTGTAGKHHGRRKKKVQQSSLQLAKRSSEIEGTDDEGTSSEVEQNESNRRALGFQEWGAQLTSLLPLDLQYAVRLIHWFLPMSSCVQIGTRLWISSDKCKVLLGSP